MFSGFEDAIVKFTQTGKLSFSDLVTTIEGDLTKLLLNQALSALFSSLANSSNPLAAAAAGAFGFAAKGASGTAHAAGGPVSAGTSYLVGEHGAKCSCRKTAEQSFRTASAHRTSTFPST